MISYEKIYVENILEQTPGAVMRGLDISGNPIGLGYNGYIQNVIYLK